MSATLSTPSHDVRWGGYSSSGLAVAVCGCVAVLVGASSAAMDLSRSERSVSRASVIAVIVAVPLASVTFGAPPAVTAPTASVSRFSVDPLPLVASVVGARLLAQVILSRHGVHHGP